MKSYIYIIIVFVGILFISCEQNIEIKPTAKVEYSSTNMKINESVEFTFTGTAKQVVVYTGEKEHNYDTRSSLITGFVVNKNKFTYAYKLPGTYKVVFVASSYTDGATSITQDTCSVIIRVVDTNTSINKISCPQILYDEVFAQNYENDWLLTIPKKVLFNNRDVNISSLQRLSVVLGSDSSRLTLNNADFKSTDKYDLAAPIDFKVTANSGDVSSGKLYTIFYPEFSTFKILNFPGIIVREVYSYNRLSLTFSVPIGTDVSNVAPEFTTSSITDKVFIDNAEQISGITKVNFTEPIEYSVINQVADRPELKAETKFRVKISFQ